MVSSFASELRSFFRARDTCLMFHPEIYEQIPTYHDPSSGPKGGWVQAGREHHQISYRVLVSRHAV